jgi:hypothetical protein
VWRENIAGSLAINRQWGHRSRRVDKRLEMHENSKLLFAAHGKQFLRSKSRVLEIGPHAFSSSCTKIIGDETIIWDTLDISNGEKLTYPKSSEYSFPVLVTATTQWCQVR